MALTLSGTNGVVGAGFTVDASGVSVTAGVGTFGSLAAPAAGLTGALPALDAANLTSINAAQLVGVCTSGLTKGGGGFGKIIQVVSTTKTDAASNSTATQNWWSYTDSSLIATITPTSASNKIMIWGTMNMGVDSQQWMMLRLEKDGIRINEVNGDQDNQKSRCFTAQSYHADSNESMPYTNMIVQALVDAGSTSSRYYNFGLAHTSSVTRTVYINRGTRTTNDFYTPMVVSTITAMEVEV